MKLIILQSRSVENADERIGFAYGNFKVAVVKDIKAGAKTLIAGRDIINAGGSVVFTTGKTAMAGDFYFWLMSTSQKLERFVDAIIINLIKHFILSH